MIGLPSFLGASLRSAPAFQGPPAGALPGSAAGAQRSERSTVHSVEELRKS